MTNPRSDIAARIPVSDIAALLAERAESLCRELLPAGHREGAEWTESSRKNGGLGDSLRVHLTGAKAGVWSHFASRHRGDALDLVAYLACAGDKGRAIRWAKSFLGIGDVDRPTTARRPQPDRKKTERSDDSAGRTKAALDILQASKFPLGTLVETYLPSRSIKIMPPPVLKFHHGLYHAPSRRTFPAMVASVQTLDGRVVAIHRTFLRPDGRGKADVTPCKMALGPLGSGAIHLGPATPAMGVAEGIETALSAMQLFQIPVWAALGSRLDRVALPECVVEVQIFGDNGKPGREAAERAAEAYLGEGRRVVVRFPPDQFGDWNDALSAEVAA